VSLFCHGSFYALWAGLVWKRAKKSTKSGDVTEPVNRSPPVLAACNRFLIRCTVAVFLGVVADISFVVDIFSDESSRNSVCTALRRTPTAIQFLTWQN
jgi:hypothetical protein